MTAGSVAARRKMERSVRIGKYAVWSGLFAATLAGCQGDVTQPSGAGTVVASISSGNVSFGVTSFATTSRGQIIMPGENPSTAGVADVIVFPGGVWTNLGSIELNSSDAIGGTVPQGDSALVAATPNEGCHFDSWRISSFDGPILSTSASFKFVPQNDTYIARVTCDTSGGGGLEGGGGGGGLVP